MRWTGGMADKPILYTLATCPACTKARRDLKADDVEFEERVIDKNAAWYEEALTYAATVPILVEGDKVTVGWKGEHG